MAVGLFLGKSHVSVVRGVIEYVRWLQKTLRIPIKRGPTHTCSEFLLTNGDGTREARGDMGSPL